MHIKVSEKDCVGCRICELACSFQLTQEFNPEASKIRIYFGDNGELKIETKECECNRPLCIAFCPVHAMTITDSKERL